MFLGNFVLLISNIWSHGFAIFQNTEFFSVDFVSILINFLREKSFVFEFDSVFNLEDEISEETFSGNWKQKMAINKIVKDNNADCCSSIINKTRTGSRHAARQV